MVHFLVRHRQGTEKMIGIYLVIAIVLLQGSLTVEAVNIGKCVDILIGMSTTGTEQCAALTEFIKCLIQELELLTTNASKSEIDTLENIVKESLFGFGINCRVNLRVLLQKIRDDENRGITFPTRQPTGFDDAETKGDCVNAMYGSNTAVGGIDCALITPFVKCLIRVTEYYKEPHTLMNQASLVSDAQEQLRVHEIPCIVDVIELSDEVAMEIKTTTISTTSEAISATPETISATIETISATPEIISATPEPISAKSETISATPKDLSATPEDLSTTPRTISTTPNDLSSIPKDLSSTPKDLSSTPGTISTTPNDLSSTPNYLSSTPKDLSSTPKDLSSTPKDLSTTPQTTPATPTAMTKANATRLFAVRPYSESTTIADCWEAYYPIDFRTVVSPCAELSNYMKCLIWVSGAFKLKYYIKLQTVANNEVLRLGRPCYINVPSLGEEVQRENSGNSRTFTQPDISLLISLLITAYVHFFI